MQVGYINLGFTSCGGLKLAESHDFPQPCGANVGASQQRVPFHGTKWHAVNKKTHMIG